jgi:hypothetical protein
MQFTILAKLNYIYHCSFWTTLLVANYSTYGKQCRCRVIYDLCLFTCRFTCKVLIQITGTSATLLECYSDPKLQKKAAHEHAAEGALWYLKQLGYLPKDDNRV